MFGVRYDISGPIGDTHVRKQISCTQCENINTTKSELKTHNITNHVDTIFEFEADEIWKCNCCLCDLWKIT